MCLCECGGVSCDIWWFGDRVAVWRREGGEHKLVGLSVIHSRCRNFF